jgi:hypothetical protein
MSADGDIIEFGRFRLHRRDRTLLANGLKPDLGVRAIAVLLALIDAGGKVVTKDALLDRVWSGVRASARDYEPPNPLNCSVMRIVPANGSHEVVHPLLCSRFC